MTASRKAKKNAVVGTKQVVVVRAAWPWTGVSYIFHGARYTDEYLVSGNVLLQAEERDTPARLASLAIVEHNIAAVGMALQSHIAHLHALGYFPVQTAVVTGNNTSWSLTLENCDTPTNIGNTTTQGRFAVFVLHETNTGNYAASPDTDLTFTARDSKGRNYTMDTALSDTDLNNYYGLSSPGFDDVQPTFSTDFVVVFEVAKDAKGVTLYGAGGFSTDNSQPLFTLWHE